MRYVTFVWSVREKNFASNDAGASNGARTMYVAWYGMVPMVGTYHKILHTCILIFYVGWLVEV